MLQIDLSSLFGENSIDSHLEVKLNQLLDFAQPGDLCRFTECMAASLYAWLGEKSRWYISSKLKSRSNKSRHLLFDIQPSDEIINIARSVGDNTSLKSRNGAFLMTHDVDYVAGYKSIPWIAELEYSYGIKASYNFLVCAGYSIDSSLLRDLRDMKHEIGLHGYVYDLRLAYRKKTTIFNTVKRAKEKLEDILGERVFGFRNHSLLLSHDMLAVIADLAFLYNSGIYPKANIDGFNSYFCFPFKYRNTNLHEIPVLYPQDTEIFRSANLEDGMALSYFIKKIKFVQGLNGVACLNHHPSIIKDHKKYYEELLRFVASETIINETPGSFIQTYYCMR